MVSGTHSGCSSLALVLSSKTWPFAEGGARGRCDCGARRGGGPGAVVVGRVTARAGHSKVSTTLDLYAGEFEKRKANDSGQRLAAIFTGALT